MSLAHRADNLARDIGTILTGPGEARYGIERAGEPPGPPFDGTLESSCCEELGATT